MGGAISGYCAMGSTRIATRPASAMKMDSTAAKIGRSMKKRENMVGLLLLRRRAGCSRRGRVRVADHEGRARHHHHLHEAVGDHLVAGGHAGEHDPVGAGPV